SSGASARLCRLEALEAPLSDLDDGAVQAAGRQVEGINLIAVDSTSPALDQPTGFTGRHPEVLAQQRGYVNGVSAGQRRLVDLVGERAFHVQPVEVGLGRARRILTLELAADGARQGPFRLHRGPAGIERLVEQ